MKERRRWIWYFTCTKCGKSRRSSMKKKRATDGICKKCQKLEIDKNQASLFDVSVANGVTEYPPQAA